MCDSLPPPRRTGVVILAGGMGTRLGCTGAKGCVMLPNGKTLYESLLDGCKGLPVAIFVSPFTRDETARAHPDVPLCMQEEANGNGAVFRSVVESDFFREWDVDSISFLQVDNPLARPFLGMTDLDVVAFRIGADESVGRLYERDGALFCCEYFEAPPPSLRYAYTGIFSASKGMIERAAAFDFPPHTVVKQEKERVEYFVFDAFHMAQSYRVLDVPRERYFSPIKTKLDLKAYKK